MTNKSDYSGAIVEVRDAVRQFLDEVSDGDGFTEWTELKLQYALTKLDALIAAVPEDLKEIDFSSESDDPYDLCDICVESSAILHEAMKEKI